MDRIDLSLLLDLPPEGQVCAGSSDRPFVLQVCAFNRTVSKVDDFLAKEAKGTKVIGAQSLKDMVSKLKKPRRVILLVKAGQAVDDFIEKLVPLLDTGDIIIDGGNSEYWDMTRGCWTSRPRAFCLRGAESVVVRKGLSMGHNSCQEGTKRFGPTSRRSSKLRLQK